MTEPVADWMRAAHRITVLTGAGISTDSGIPDIGEVLPRLVRV